MPPNNPKSAEEKALEALKAKVEAQKDFEKQVSNNLEKFASFEKLAAIIAEHGKSATEAQEEMTKIIDSQLGKKKAMLTQEELILEKNKLILESAKIHQAFLETQVGKEQELLTKAEDKVKAANKYLDKLGAANKASEIAEGLQDNIRILLGKTAGETVDWKKELIKVREDQKKTIANQKKIIEGGAKAAKSAEVHAQQQERVVEASSEAATETGKNVDAADDLLLKFFGINKATTSFTMKLIKSARESGGIGKALLKGFFDAEKQADALFGKIEEMVGGALVSLKGMFLEVDQSIVDLTRSTAQFDRGLKEEIDAIAESGEKLGVTYAESAAAYGTLFASSKGFITLSRGQQVEAGKLATQFQKMGISAESFGKTLTLVTQAFGGTLESTRELTREISGFATNLNMLPSQALESFNQSMSVLARNSMPEAVKQFKELSVVAQQTGVAISDLLTITAQFETFDSALNIVGELNSMLGGPFLNSIDLMNAAFDEPAQVIMQLREGIAASGQDFNTMDAAMQKAIAQAAGISDMSIASQILGSDMDVAAIDKALNGTIDSFDELGKKAAENLSISETFSMIMQDVFRQLQDEGVDVGKLFKDIATAIRGIIKFLAEMDPGIMKVGMIAMILSPLISILGNIIGLFGGLGVAATTSGVAMTAAGLKAQQSMAMATGAMGGAIAKLGILMGAYGMYKAATADEKGWDTVIGGAASGAMTGASLMAAGGPHAMALGALVMGTVGAIGGADWSNEPKGPHRSTRGFAGGTQSLPQGLSMLHAGESFKDNQGGMQSILKDGLVNTRTAGGTVYNRSQVRSQQMTVDRSLKNLVNVNSQISRERIAAQHTGNVINMSNGEKLDELSASVREEKERNIIVNPPPINVKVGERTLFSLVDEHLTNNIQTIGVS